MKTLGVGIIGMGGFARSHHAALLELEQEGLCKVVCTCDPEPEAFNELAENWKLAERGVRVFDNYLRMLDTCRYDLDIVTIPTPIPLHAEMHSACVRRGLAVYLEKPPTVSYSELNHMLTVEKMARKLTNVGFNFIIEEPRQALKQRLLDGEFGKIGRVQMSGLWPRPASYFKRASWPGRLMMDGKLVLDSCMGNALAHYLHNVLFWTGKEDLLSWGHVAKMQAELYRAHDIEGMDTIFAKAETTTGIKIDFALTHACAGEASHQEFVLGDLANVQYVTGKYIKVRFADGRYEPIEPDKRVLLKENLRHYLSYVRGDCERPITRLADSRPFVEFNDLAYIAAGEIHTVPEEHLTREGEFVAINDIGKVLTAFCTRGAFPSAQGMPWAKPGGTATPEDLPKLNKVIEQMVAARNAERG